MEFKTWNVEPSLVGKQDAMPRITASSPCPCGCSPKPFVYITNGLIGLTACFDTQEEMEGFKRLVDIMSF